jgi:hypothetical protein
MSQENVLISELAIQLGLAIDVTRAHIIYKVIELAERDKDFDPNKIKNITLRKDPLIFKQGLLKFDVFVAQIDYFKGKTLIKRSIPIHFQKIDSDINIDLTTLFTKTGDFLNDIKSLNARGFVYQEELSDLNITKDFISLFDISYLTPDLYPTATSKIINVITLNLLILIEEKAGNILNSPDKRISDEQAEYKHSYNKLLGLLDPFIRLKIQKRGIVTIQNTYVGFDTEYESINATTNKLLSVQLAVSTKTMVKIPKNTFDISNKDEDTIKESAVIQDLRGFNNDLFKNVINDGIKRYRSSKYKIYDMSINQLKLGLLDLLQHRELKHLKDNSYDIFAFPRTEIRTAIFIDEVDNGFTLVNLINEAKNLVKDDINKTYEDLINVLKEIHNKVSMKDLNETELLTFK